MILKISELFLLYFLHTTALKTIFLLYFFNHFLHTTALKHKKKCFSVKISSIFQKKKKNFFAPTKKIYPVKRINFFREKNFFFLLKKFFSSSSSQLVACRDSYQRINGMECFDLQREERVVPEPFLPLKRNKGFLHSTFEWRDTTPYPLFFLRFLGPLKNKCPST